MVKSLHHSPPRLVPEYAFVIRRPVRGGDFLGSHSRRGPVVRGQRVITACLHDLALRLVRTHACHKVQTPQPGVHAHLSHFRKDVCDRCFASKVAAQLPFCENNYDGLPADLIIFRPAEIMVYPVLGNADQHIVRVPGEMVRPQQAKIHVSAVP